MKAGDLLPFSGEILQLKIGEFKTPWLGGVLISSLRISAILYRREAEDRRGTQRMPAK
jgi:hypothetical protein